MSSKKVKAVEAPESPVQRLLREILNMLEPFQSADVRIRGTELLMGYCEKRRQGLL